VITIDELYFGFTIKPNRRIERWFDRFLGSHCVVLEVARSIARHAGILRGQLSGRGKPRTQADMLIAATAAVHGLTLATRNERDFAHCGISVLNPWT
jgi:predicted nucleic acid-binding protein